MKPLEYMCSWTGMCPRFSSSGTSQSMNTYTPMASSASPSFTTVLPLLFRVVTRPHCQLDLPLSAFDAQQRKQKDKAIK